MVRHEEHSRTRSGRVVAETRIGEHNQLTLPNAVAEAASFGDGDRFVVTFESDHPDTIRLDRIRDSYLGSLTEAYGDPHAYLDDVRAGWR
jgi:hypothetical protein